MVEMESWSWPPRYDDSYRPQASSRYWFPERETMPPGDREKAIVERLRQVCQYAHDHSPFYRKRWDEAGFHPEQVKSLEDFERRCPVIAKADLRKAQEAYPPFGNYLCVPENEVWHIHGTSGTTGRPTAFGISQADWRAIANAHARIMLATVAQAHGATLVGLGVIDWLARNAERNGVRAVLGALFAFFLFRGRADRSPSSAPRAP